MRPDRHCAAMPWASAVSWALAGVLVAACGGGGGSPSGAGGCERVSGGTSSLTLRNQLTSGVQAYLPPLSVPTWPPANAT